MLTYAGAAVVRDEYGLPAPAMDSDDDDDVVQGVLQRRQEHLAATTGNTSRQKGRERRERASEREGGRRLWMGCTCRVSASVEKYYAALVSSHSQSD